MTPQEYDYYSSRLTQQESQDYLVMKMAHTRGKISDALFNGMHDSFWDCVKERVDKEEEEEK